MLPLSKKIFKGRLGYVNQYGLLKMSPFFSPPGSLNKRKKKDKETKKAQEFDAADFDNLAPDDMLLNDIDESFLDPAMVCLS